MGWMQAQRAASALHVPHSSQHAAAPWPRPPPVSLLQHCEPVLKLLLSAAANAKQNLGLRKAKLVVSECFADAGPVLKRAQPRAQVRLGGGDARCVCGPACTWACGCAAVALHRWNDGSSGNGGAAVGVPQTANRSGSPTDVLPPRAPLAPVRACLPAGPRLPDQEAHVPYHHQGEGV